MVRDSATPPSKTSTNRMTKVGSQRRFASLENMTPRYPSFRAGLQLQEDLPLVQPVAGVPHHCQNRARLRHRGQCSDPLVVERKDTCGTVQPSAEDHAQRIDEDRVGSYDHERESPVTVAQNLSQQVETDQHEEYPAETIQDERRCAKLLDHRNPRLQTETSDKREHHSADKQMAGPCRRCLYVPLQVGRNTGPGG